ncbi:hypothetical protein [Coxiella endosymbiont of Rhipicephalus microplus]|nr:hypothetical protein [Coxiella endosymbiont of Rhipicephalus microplus]
MECCGLESPYTFYKTRLGLFFSLVLMFDTRREGILKLGDATS